MTAILVAPVMATGALGAGSGRRERSGLGSGCDAHSGREHANE